MNVDREVSRGENHRFGYVEVWFSVGFVRFVRAVRNREYGPGGVGRRKSSIWIRLGMVFHRVREGGQKQGIWTGREASGSENYRFGYVEVWFSIGFVRAVRNGEYGPGGIGRQKSSIWNGLVVVFRMVGEGGQTGNIGRETSGGQNHRFGLHTESRPHTESIQ